MKVLENVDLDLTDPHNPIAEVKIPIYVLREEEYTSNVKMDTPKLYLFETVTKVTSFTEHFSNTFNITNLNKLSFKQELSHLYRIKRKCIDFQYHRFQYHDSRYHYIGSIFFVMNDKYYYAWQAKYRNMLIEQVLK